MLSPDAGCVLEDSFAGVGLVDGLVLSAALCRLAPHLSLCPRAGPVVFLPLGSVLASLLPIFDSQVFSYWFVQVFKVNIQHQFTLAAILLFDFMWGFPFTVFLHFEEVKSIPYFPLWLFPSLLSLENLCHTEIRYSSPAIFKIP